MDDFSEKKEWVFDNDSNGADPPEPNLNTTIEDESNPEEPEEPKRNFKLWMVVPILGILILFGGAFMGHYFVIEPVMPIGKDSYLSDMGLFGWAFNSPTLESATVADFFSGGLAFVSVILTDLFLHFLLIAGYLDYPEHFLNRPSLKLRARMILCSYTGTLLIESGSLYMRMQMNDQIMNDPDNPLRSFQIHGMGELFGYSLLIIFLNAVFAFLTILLMEIIKKELKK